MYTSVELSTTYIFVFTTFDVFLNYFVFVNFIRALLKFFRNVQKNLGKALITRLTNLVHLF